MVRMILKYDVSVVFNHHSPPPLSLMSSAPPLIADLTSTDALDSLPLHVPALVRQISAPAEMPEWATWLAEIGFLPGESVRVIARGAMGSDPLVVRIGDSTFALRKAEAACVQVQRATDELARS
jgi:ferrous iron transport protein A